MYLLNLFAVHLVSSDSGCHEYRKQVSREKIQYTVYIKRYNIVLNFKKKSKVIRKYFSKEPGV